jgi:hypothetical protein
LKHASLQIGSISLQNFEIPSTIQFGGQHRLAVYQLAQGRKIVDSLGPDDGEISFSGTFSGIEAEARVRAVDDLRLTGKVVWLRWESFRYRVIVKSLIAQYKSPWWIPYQIRCIVIQQSRTKNNRTSLTQVAALADLASAETVTTSDYLDLSDVRAALSGKNVFVNGTLDHARAINETAKLKSIVEMEIVTRSTQLTEENQLDSNCQCYTETLRRLVDNAGQLASAVNVGAYVGRIGVRLNGSFE